MREDNNYQEDNNYEIDLFDLLYELKRKIVPIIAWGVAGVLIAWILCSFVITPQYESTSKLYIQTKSEQAATVTSLAPDYVELVKCRPVVNKVISDLGLDMSYDTMMSKMDVENPDGTHIIKITIRDDNPTLAKEMADDFVTIAEKRISNIMQTDKPTIVERGSRATSPVIPNTKRYMLIGGLLGLLLSVSYLIIKYMCDDTIKSVDDVEKYLGLYTLSVIPVVEGARKAESGKKLRKKK